ncbi:MAG: TIGR02453 family protein [Planctomycetes bacterium]|nr:TIGR02453 family protein [Planctomycetota bacterium]NOG52757.1 TIGR02453 family protein [Planctomycetota bacterium]
MPDHDFTGFGKSAATFLTTLSENNNRTWFNEHKADYERFIVQPAFAFIEAMAPRLAAISPHFRAIPGKQGGSLMRIYRDTRFGHNKAPYKVNIGIQFRHEAGKDVHTPGFYFNFQPPGLAGIHGFGGHYLGVGIWRPDRDALAHIRKRIVAKPKEWDAANQAKSYRKHFKDSGDSLKRPPRGFNPDHPYIDDPKQT